MMSPTSVLGGLGEDGQYDVSHFNAGWEGAI